LAEHLRWWVGNRNPSITENLVYDDGTAVDLTAPAATVKFKMRAVGASTLTVDQAATIVDAATGQVRYDWAAVDVDTAGEYLVWWEVTVSASGKTQDYNEALIEIAAHDVGANAYLELEELKSTLELTGWSGSDLDLAAAILSASRAIDDMTQTRFFTTTSDEERYYTPDAAHVLFTDEINELTELATDDAGGDTFATVWTSNTDYVLEPLNATLDSRPWHTIRVASRTGRRFRCYQRSVRVTGKFGWTSAPEAIRLATGIIATKLVKRAKDAPMGVLTFFDGTAVRLSRFDPQVEELLAPYNRSTPFA
jgi:hypothetical protein